jgi:hypothetical protein
MKDLKQRDKKRLFHEHNRLNTSMVWALLISLIGKYTDAMSSSDSLVSFIVIFPLIYLMQKSRYPGAKYRSWKFDNTVEELIVAAKNAGLKLIRINGKVFVFSSKVLWFKKPLIEVIDNGNTCQVIANEDAIECLRENILID